MHIFVTLTKNYHPLVKKDMIGPLDILRNNNKFPHKDLLNICIGNIQGHVGRDVCELAAHAHEELLPAQAHEPAPGLRWPALLVRGLLVRSVRMDISILIYFKYSKHLFALNRYSHVRYCYVYLRYEF